MGAAAMRATRRRTHAEHGPLGRMAFSRHGVCAGTTAFALAACSAFDPKVGPSQESCGIAPIGSSATPGAGAPYGGAANPSATSGGTSASSTSALACALDAGSPCDDCESRWCCATRTACYEDPVCICLDANMDTCVTAAGSDSNAIAACWNAFARGGAVEAARVVCETAWCQATCGIP
jgi:hypothetical protein